MPNETAIPSAQALTLSSLVTPTAHGIASRVLARTAGGNVTLFAFDAGQGLEEHTSPFDALVLATTNTPEDSLARALDGGDLEIHCVGDCVAPRHAPAATYEGRKLGLAL